MESLQTLRQKTAVETMQRLEGIVASAMDGIITIDDEQRIILFNPAAERMFGLPAHEALGEHISRFMPERYRPTHAAHIHHFAKTGVTTRQMGSLGAISGLRANGEEFPIEASISQVEVGGERLSTVILLIHELATNAVKYGALSVSGGRVDVSWRILPSYELELRWVEYGGPPVKKPESKGFGSVLMTEVATRQLSGRIDVTWPTSGMCLVATLPSSVYRPDIAAGPAPGKADPHKAGSRRRILVVEDEALIAMELCMELESRGWEIVGPAATTDEAMRLIDGASLPDVAVLDVNLGGQMVYPFAEWLRSHDVPFLFCTGYEQLDDHKRFSSWPTIRKPVNMTLLDSELNRIWHPT